MKHLIILVLLLSFPFKGKSQNNFTVDVIDNTVIIDDDYQSPYNNTYISFELQGDCFMYESPVFAVDDSYEFEIPDTLLSGFLIRRIIYNGSTTQFAGHHWRMYIRDPNIFSPVDIVNSPCDLYMVDWWDLWINDFYYELKANTKIPDGVKVLNTILIDLDSGYALDLNDSDVIYINQAGVYKVLRIIEWQNMVFKQYFDIVHN